MKYKIPLACLVVLLKNCFCHKNIEKCCFYKRKMVHDNRLPKYARKTRTVKSMYSHQKLFCTYIAETFCFLSRCQQWIAPNWTLHKIHNCFLDQKLSSYNSSTFLSSITWILVLPILLLCHFKQNGISSFWKLFWENIWKKTFKRHHIFLKKEL